MKTVMTNLKVLFFYIFLYLTFGCNDSNSIKHYKVPKSNHNIGKHESNTNYQGNLKWIKPDSWIQYNGSSLRLLSFKIPYSNNEADLSVMILDGDGGGLSANINRWCRQLGIPNKTDHEIEEMAELMDGSMGKYKLFQLIGDADSNNSFLCSIIPMNKKTLFVKMNLNSNGIAEVKNDFKQFCSSLDTIK